MRNRFLRSALVILGFALFIFNSLEAREVVTAQSLIDDPSYPIETLSSPEQKALWNALTEKGELSPTMAEFLAHNQYFRIHRGPLAIAGDFDIGDGNSLVVEGDLRVDGNYDDTGTGHLVVLGDMRAQNVLNSGTLAVTGKLQAGELVYCFYNDNISEFGGGVEARALFVYDHYTEFPEEKTKVDFWAHDGFGDSSVEVFRHLVPSLVAQSYAESDGDHPRVPDWGKCSELVYAGESLFREQPAPENLLEALEELLEEDSIELEDLERMCALDESLRILIAGREDLTPSTVALLQNFKESSVLQALAKNPVVSPEVLQAIAKSSPASRPSMACNPSAPDEVVEELSKDPSPEVRALVARRANLSTDVAERLASDSDAKVRRYLVSGASLYRLNAEALARLSEDKDEELVESLLNKDIPLRIDDLHRLAGHHSVEVRRKAARRLKQEALWQHRPAMPLLQRQELAEKLLKDPERAVFQIAVCALSPERQLEVGRKWLNSPGSQRWCYNLAEATTSPELMLEIAKVGSSDLRENLASNLALTTQAQLALLKPLGSLVAKGEGIPEELGDIINELVQNENLSREAFLVGAQLSQQTGAKHQFSRDLLHQSRHIPNEALRILHKIPGSDFREDLALTTILAPRATRDILKVSLFRWYDSEDHRELRQEFEEFKNLETSAFWEAMSKAKTPELREIAARNHHSTQEAILRLARDEDSEVRRAALDHPRFPLDHPILLKNPEVLAALAQPRISESKLLELVGQFRLAGKDYRADSLLEQLASRRLRRSESF